MLLKIIRFKNGFYLFLFMATKTKIQYVGLNELEIFDRKIVTDIAESYTKKIERIINNDFSIKVHLKSYKEGGRNKYGVHVQVLAPTKTFTSTKAVGWKITDVSHSAFEKIIREIQHYFKQNQHKPKHRNLREKVKLFTRRFF